MGELLPTVAGRSIQSELLDYLDTTFALSDRDAREALKEFLRDPRGGVFKGPYLRLRLPFRPAEPRWRDALGWHPRDEGRGFEPYRHQAAAFARLSSLSADAAPSRPLPTLVTTGTGSGKTEAFLYPILDHVLRAKARGVGGMKALLLYPMNALANDQAQRLAELITSLPSLAGVTAGLYTGEQQEGPTIVTPDALIGARNVIRSSPPDILLTNYKMLDQMLLRSEDAKIWAQSAHSLQYLVLDEFHTYDGAQGTDVAMLLRRLGLTLKAHGASGERPLAQVTPVATSATLGDGGDPAAMLAFAETVFGEPFPADAVVTESRLTADEWIDDAIPPAGAIARDGAELVERVRAVARNCGAEPEADALAAAVLGVIYEGDVGDASPIELVRAHPLTRRLLEHGAEAAELGALAALVLPGADVAEAQACLVAYAGLLSHLRFSHGRALPSVEAHLWIRELTRVDRVAGPSPAFTWSDDGTAPLGADAGQEAGLIAGRAFPAIYCRHCGRSGWGIMLSPANNTDLDDDDTDIRRRHANKEGKFRPLLFAPAEGWGETAGSASGDNLRWLHVAERQLLVGRPPDAVARDGSVVPVLTHVGPDADDESRADNCPSCQQRDGIRFLGSAIATQLSVALSTLFGSVNLAAEEKKTLVFTDSVQDAAHRAGFVQARSRSLTVRSMLREAIGTEPRLLDMLADRVIERAGDDSALRYRILPPDLVDDPGFRSFWTEPTLASVRIGVRNRVRKRIAFDAMLEFGLQSRLGRTLELTGTVAAEVTAAPALLLAVARRTLDEAGGQLTFEEHRDEVLVAWVRGVLERMRERGSIQHDWLNQLIQTDGRRRAVWGGRPKGVGMPAFPHGRTAPAFPRVGPQVATREERLLDPVANAQSWYARWTARLLTITPAEAATVARLLFKRLAAANADVVTVTSNKAGAEVYALRPDAIVVAPITDAALAASRHLLVCDSCQSVVPGSETVVDQLDGAPCMAVRCDGRMMRAAGDPDNFYRRFFASHEVQRVIAREHTSLLDPQDRIAYENGFKGKAVKPDAPNVLVATPTLEMGIDIGDLSTVMLASLPRTVANYLQRVGRAGRLSGSALNLAFVSGRGDQLPKLGEPLSMINGRVRPPATYVSAEELMRRQFIASLGDVEARMPDGVHPVRATGAIGAMGPDSYLHALAKRGEQDSAHMEAFLAGFPTLSERVRDSMRLWVTPIDGELTSPLARRLRTESQRWQRQLELLDHRIATIERALPALRQSAESPAAIDDDKQALKAAIASSKLARGQRADMRGNYWVGVMERAGLFPNYTLLDDIVTLDVGISWPDPDSGEFETATQEYHRAAAQALRDFAPGATFYARGQKVKVSAVDLGSRGESVRTRAFCAACGYSLDITEQTAPSACPRCADAAIADVNQRFDVVELTRASSSMRRDEAAIDDDRDEREQMRFNIAVAADFAPADVTRQWYVSDLGFGAKHVRDLQLRWLNLGRASGLGTSRDIAGREFNAELFRVCAECGQLDRRTSSNNRYEHRPWCPQREAVEEHTKSIALSRTLRTEGLLLRLPPMTSLGSSFALPSLAAAIKRGLREHLGGAPDHLALEAVVDPAPGDPLGNREALLIHDVVPGGTGYLADLAEPATLWTVLYRAYEVVRDCACRESGRDACPDCLLSFSAYGQGHFVSRAEAEKQLLELLLGGAAGEPDPQHRPPWTITDVPPVDFDPESKLEQKFRAVFKERLQKLGATIKVSPQTAGERWEIVVGGRAWNLQPQVNVAGSKPDFLLRCGDPNVPPVAIFCDGRRFHASPQHNRLADDAEKREVLRERGMHVVALCWRDLVDDGADRATPPWLVERAVALVMGMKGLAITPSLIELLRAGPLDLLLAWIRSPDTAGLQQLGRAIPFLVAAPDRPRGALAAEQDLAGAAVDLLARGTLDGASAHGNDDATAWAWRDGGVALLARHIGGTSDPEVVLMLDDAEEAIAADDGTAWESWLRLGNLLGPRLQDPSVPTAITVRSAAGRATPVPAGATAAPAVALGSAWTQLFDQATADERRFLELLAADGSFAPPALGPEVNGIPLGPSWIEQRVTIDVDLGLGESERFELSEQGWTVVAATLDEVRAALSAGGD